jgi:hyperosmotically inducible protein
MKLATRWTIAALLLGTLCLQGWSLLSAQDSTMRTAPADNTNANQRDRHNGETTADQQSNNRSDIDITKQVRRALVADKSLSTYAHNVKVITQNGSVILKGPVRSEEEKQAVEQKTAAIVGADHVSSQLAVATK